MKKSIFKLTIAFISLFLISNTLQAQHKAHQNNPNNKVIYIFNNERETVAFPMLITPNDKSWQHYMFTYVPHYRTNYMIYSNIYWFNYYVKNIHQQRIKNYLEYKRNHPTFIPYEKLNKK